MRIYLAEAEERVGKTEIALRDVRTAQRLGESHPRAYYRMAKIYSRLAQRQPKEKQQLREELRTTSLQLLRRALQIGYTDEDHLKKDPEWESLRKQMKLKPKSSVAPALLDRLHQRLLLPAMGNITVNEAPLRGALESSDPVDGVANVPGRHSDVVAVSLKAGRSYLIELKGRPQARLRVEDAKGKILLDDQFTYLVQGEHLGMLFSPLKDGNYRIVISAEKRGFGPYELQVRGTRPSRKPVLIATELTAKDLSERGKHLKVMKIPLQENLPCVIQVQSSDFEPVLLLIDGTTKRILDRCEFSQSGKALLRLTFTPQKNRSYLFAVSSFGRGKVGKVTFHLKQFTR